MERPGTPQGVPVLFLLRGTGLSIGKQISYRVNFADMNVVSSAGCWA
jgi:hypothetical protein